MTQYKNKKPRTVNFYHIEGKDETLKKLDDKISTTYNLLKTHHSDQIETIEMGDNKYYIYSMNKAYVDESGQIYAWLINLSRLDPTSPIQVRRFKEFENSAAWEQRKLGEVVDVRSGHDYKHLHEGNIPVYGTGGYMLNVDKALSENEDAIGIGRKGTIDKPYLLKAPFWTVDTLFYSIPKKNYDLNFVNYVFQRIRWKKYDESTAVPSLSKATINSVLVFMPNYREQKQIGVYLERIDSLITLHQRKLDKLKKMKAAYLNEMFV